MCMDLESVVVWQVWQPSLLARTSSSDWLFGAGGAVTYLGSSSPVKILVKGLACATPPNAHRTNSAHASPLATCASVVFFVIGIFGSIFSKQTPRSAGNNPDRRRP